MRRTQLSTELRLGRTQHVGCLGCVKVAMSEGKPDEDNQSVWSNRRDYLQEL